MLFSVCHLFLQLKIFLRTLRGLKKQGSETLPDVDTRAHRQRQQWRRRCLLPPPHVPSRPLWSCVLLKTDMKPEASPPPALRRSPGKCSHPHPPHTHMHARLHVCSHWPQALKTAPRLIDQEHNKDARKAAGAERKMPACVWIKDGTQERDDHQAPDTVILTSFSFYTHYI